MDGYLNDRLFSDTPLFVAMTRNHWISFKSSFSLELRDVTLHLIALWRAWQSLFIKWQSISIM